MIFTRNPEHRNDVAAKLGRGLFRRLDQGNGFIYDKQWPCKKPALLSSRNNGGSRLLQLVQ
ncbi:hypothetical protein D3C77_630390 [compost metagenome]